MIRSCLIRVTLVLLLFIAGSFVFQNVDFFKKTFGKIGDLGKSSLESLKIKDSNDNNKN